MSNTKLLAETQLRFACETLLNTVEGRLVFRHLLSVYGVRQSSFDENPHIHAFRSGMQNAGLLLEALLAESSPSLFVTLMQERTNELE